MSSCPPLLPPDVPADTSGHGACSRSPCGCACPNLVKVCWLEKRSFTQRTGVLLSPLLCPSCPVSQRCWQWDALASAVHGAALVLISCFLCFLLSFSFCFVAPLSVAFLLSPLCFYSFFLSLFSFLWFLFPSIRCPNDFTGDRCQTYVMASFYRMSISSSVCQCCMLELLCYELLVIL